MKLFFETAMQAGVFLMMVPAGLLLALLTDLSGRSGNSRPLWDVLIMLSGGLILGWLLIITGDSRLRLYHLLAVLTGAVLYLTGIRRILYFLSAEVSKRKRKMPPDTEGKTQQSVE